MATRIYVDATDFDALQGHFTIEVVDGQYYLRIGALDSPDQRLVESLIADGYVGFFDEQDERVAITGIISTYDATNARIEVDSVPNGLVIGAEYIIRFTQARPGDDGTGSCNFTIALDGKDGWSPKFATVADGERRVLQVADWFGGGGTKPDVGQYIGETGFVAAIADGVDIRGPAGEDGEDGTGICTALTVLDDSDGSENLRTAELPTNYTDYDNIYFNIFGNNEFRQNSLKISTLVNGRRYRVGGISDIVWNETSRTFTLSDGNAAGNFRHVILTGCEDDGGDSNEGEDGWSPKFAIKSDGERRVLQVADWFGGGGIKPITGKYIGLNSFVDAITDGVDIRGPKGQDGALGIGDVLFSAGSYNPSVRQVIYKLHGNSAGWRSGGISADFVNITNPGGQWLRWGDVVLVYGCFEVSTGQRVPDGMDELSVYLSLPQGATAAGGHGIGMPLNNANSTFRLHGNQVQNKLIFTPLNGSEEKVGVEGDSIENGYSHKFGGWIPINPGLGDHTTSVSNFSQKPTEGPASNSLKIILKDPSGIGNKFTGLQGFSMIYSVASE